MPMVDFLRRPTFKTANLPYVLRIVFGCFRVVSGSCSAHFGPFSHPFAWFSPRFFCFFGVVVATSFSSSPSSSLSSGGSPPSLSPSSFSHLYGPTVGYFTIFGVASSQVRLLRCARLTFVTPQRPNIALATALTVVLKKCTNA